jgi:signal transduction histidine kinase
MKISLLLIAGKDERFGSVAIEAANAAFPGSGVARTGSLREAMERPLARVPELLVIEEADENQIAEAAQALDDHKLPRWAVVASGASAPVNFAEVVPSAEWTPNILTRVFRTSVALHLLRRDKERLLGDLLSVGVRITHDLRTPVGGVLTATEALEELQLDPKAQPSLIQPIFESAQDLVKIINQLTLVAKASGRPDVRQNFNMGAPAGRAMERLEVKADAAGATVSRPATWPDVSGDPSKTEAAWQYLLENALRHAGKRPKIELGWEPSGDEYKFWIRDNGAGVPSEKRHLLFQPFHRLHETNAVRGVGLPIVERLVHLQGGRCGYEPAPDGGACFFFTLPGISK